VTSIAYRAEPPLPGWIATAVALVAGWFIAALATAVLYLGADLIGAIGRTSPSYPGALNDWPYPDNGLWSLLANVAVVLIALVLTTMATSWWLRKAHEPVSDGRLAGVLLVTGWLPLETAGPYGGFFGFLAAVLLIRYWVARHQDHLPRKTAVSCLAGLAAVVVSYGLLHPFWTTNISPVQFEPPVKNRIITIGISNASRFAVRVDGFKLSPPFATRAVPPDFPFPSVRTSSPFVVPPRSERFLNRSLPPGGCGALVIGIHVRYHLLGLPLRQTVPARISLGSHC
jgi:hypothetical protein